LMNLFLLSIIAGAIVTKLSNHLLPLISFRKIAITFLALFLITIDQYVSTSNSYSYSKAESQDRVRIVENLVQKKNPFAKVFAYMPRRSSEPPHVIHLDAMMAAQKLNMATVNGYSGKFPVGYLGSFYENYDNCDSYLFWMMVSTRNFPDSASRYDIFRNVSIVGTEACL
jgi:hypothetical protein